VSDDEGGVPADPADEVRVAVVLEALAEHVKAGNGGDAAALAELAVGVEDGDAQPRVDPAVAGRPDDGADACLSQVQFVDHRCGPDGRDRLGVEDLAAQPVGVDVGVDPVEQGGHLPVRGGDGRRHVGREPDPAAVDRRDPPDQPDAVGLQRRQVERPVVRPADQLQRRLRPGRARIRHLVDRPVEQAGRREPPEDVHAAVAAGQPAVAADGERHVPAGGPQLVGDLHAGCRGADDEDAPGRQASGAKGPPAGPFRR